MSRSKWKGPYINIKNSKSILKCLKKPSNSFRVARDTEIVPRFVGYSFLIHNGKTWIEVTVTEEMIGYKFGEFVNTRNRFSFKKKNKK